MYFSCSLVHSQYSPTKVKHHLTCFNNIFSNNELISDLKESLETMKKDMENMEEKKVE
jgi:hypothetical protein